MFKGWLIDKTTDSVTTDLVDIDQYSLPEGDVLIDVAYSTLNYKDALAITNSGPVVRQFPMVPGIDLVGTVSESSRDDLPVGTQVILNGWGVGKNTGAVWHKKRGSAVTGWCHFLTVLICNKLWPSVPPDTLPCSV